MEDLTNNFGNGEDLGEVQNDLWQALRIRQSQPERAFLERHWLAVAATIGGTMCAAFGVNTGRAVVRRHRIATT